MKDLQLYAEISSLPSDLKQEVSDFVVSLKQKAKRRNGSLTPKINLEEPLESYSNKLSDILLNGPVYSSEQIQKIKQARKSINEWRTK